MSAGKRVLDVGQCQIDGPRIGRFLKREFDCVVDRAHSKEEALKLAAANNYDLVFVNRLLALDRSPGIEVIAALHAAYPALRVMLVSDYPEAQEEAVRQGALRGFGKSALESDATEELIRSVLANH